MIVKFVKFLLLLTTKSDFFKNLLTLPDILMKILKLRTKYIELYEFRHSFLV